MPRPGSPKGASAAVHRAQDPDPRRGRHRHAVALIDGVTGVNVTTEFVRILRAVVAEGRPKWKTVLAADSPDASPTAITGFTALLEETWTRLEEHIRAVGNSGIVLLHDATPIARYPGGLELLAKLAVAARDRTNRRPASGCSAPWRIRSPRRNWTG